MSCFEPSIPHTESRWLILGVALLRPRGCHRGHLARDTWMGTPGWGHLDRQHGCHPLALPSSSSGQETFFDFLRLLNWTSLHNTNKHTWSLKQISVITLFHPSVLEFLPLRDLGFFATSPNITFIPNRDNRHPQHPTSSSFLKTSFVSVTGHVGKSPASPGIRCTAEWVGRAVDLAAGAEATDSDHKGGPSA